MSSERNLLLRASIHRPVTVLMLLVTLTVVGAIAYRLIPLQLAPPGITENQITVRIPVPDSTPREVMEQVTEPAEELFRTIPGVTRIRSWSRANSASISVAHSSSQDGAVVYDDIRDRMERLLPSLPEGSDRYRIFRFNIETDLPVMMMAASFEESVEDADTILENVIQPRLEAVEGVARVEVHGLIAREVELELDPDQVQAYQVNVQRLIQRLGSDNMVAPGGVVEEGSRRYLIRLSSRFQSFEELQDYPVRESLSLGEIANVGYREGLRTFLARVDGKLCRLVQISKESEANTVEMCARVEREIERLKVDPRLSGFRFIPYFSQGRMIETSMASLRATCLWGGLFAILVLFLFLRHLRLTLLVATAIPLSLMMAVVVIFFRGGTFNILSLCGLTLGIGMLIDNAIVIAENIFRHRQLGSPPREAAERGVKEVALAVTLATLTTVAVFLPLIFLSGDSNVNVLLGELGLPVCYSLVASLLVALVFIPIATTYVRGESRQRSGGLTLTNAYTRLLGFCLRNRFVTIVVCMLVLGSAQIPQSLMEKQGRGEEGTHEIQLWVECPRNFTLRETDEAMEVIRKSCEPLREELGIDSMAAWYGSTGGTFAFFLRPEVRTTERDFLTRAREVLPNLPGIKIHLDQGDDESESAEKEFRIRAYGRDPAILTSLLGQISERMDNEPGVMEVRSPRDESNEEIIVQVERELAQRFDVNPGQVSNLIAWALRGAPLEDFHMDDEELPFWIRYAGGELDSIGDLYRVPVYSETGNEVPVANLASFSVDRGLPTIYRRDGRVATWLRMVTSKDADEDALRLRAYQEFSELEDLPEGYELQVTDSRQGFDEGREDVMKAGILGLVLIFVLMGVLFESFLLPVSVIFCIPFLFVGALWFAFAMGSPMSEVGMIGFVILLGIVVNNGIVLIDCINRCRAGQANRTKAILEAGQARLRPIVMTACTTIFGLGPLIFLPQQGEGIDYRPLAVVVMGGLVSSTAFTLVVVPVFYTLLDDMRGKLLDGLKGIRRRPRATADAEDYAG